MKIVAEFYRNQEKKFCWMCYNKKENLPLNVLLVLPFYKGENLWVSLKHYIAVLQSKPLTWWLIPHRVRYISLLNHER